MRCPNNFVASYAILIMHCLSFRGVYHRNASDLFPFLLKQCFSCMLYIKNPIRNKKRNSNSYVIQWKERYEIWNLTLSAGWLSSHDMGSQARGWPCDPISVDMIPLLSIFRMFRLSAMYTTPSLLMAIPRQWIITMNDSVHWANICSSRM